MTLPTTTDGTRDSKNLEEQPFLPEVNLGEAFSEDVSSLNQSPHSEVKETSAETWIDALKGSQSSDLLGGSMEQDETLNKLGRGCR